MNKIMFLLALMLGLLQSCIGQTPTQEDFLTLNGVRISKRLLSEMQNVLQQEPKEFERVNYRYKRVDSNWVEETDTLRNGFYFERISEDVARSMVDRYSTTLQANGHYIFLNELSFDESWRSLYNITIVKAESQFELLKIMNTAGPNYNLTNEQVIAKLKEWDKMVGFSIIVADQDRVEAKMSKLPKNLKQFAQEIYAFCPDVIDQGYGDFSEMMEDYRVNKDFWLWWD